MPYDLVITIRDFDISDRCSKLNLSSILDIISEEITNSDNIDVYYHACSHRIDVKQEFKY